MYPGVFKLFHRIQRRLNAGLKPDGNFKLGEIPTGLPGQFLELRHIRLDTLGSIADATPAVRQFSRTLEGGPTLSSKNERRTRVLDGLGIKSDRLEIMKFPGKLWGLFGPQGPHDAHRFPRSRGPVTKRHAHRLKLFFTPAHANPKDHPALGQDIQAGHRLGHRQRIPQGKHEDSGSELDRRGMGSHKRTAPQTGRAN